MKKKKDTNVVDEKKNFLNLANDKNGSSLAPLCMKLNFL